MSSARVIGADCLAVLPNLDAESVHSIVTDPPYGLGFMGKEWDHGVPGVPFWDAALRVAKPGAYLVAFGGTRTFHRLTCAIEDAGWEIRDCLSWLYGSGFPKSLDVSKAIDKAAGAERPVVGVKHVGLGNGRGEGFNHDGSTEGVAVTASVTDAAREWNGWGTALKPGWEPIILARKPLTVTVAENVQSHGTGALNVLGCRIEGEKGNGTWGTSNKTVSPGRMFNASPEGNEYRSEQHPLGRWPANVILDETSAELLDGQTGELTSGANPTRRGSNKFATTYGDFAGQRECEPARGLDRGGASRFYYCAKASRQERDLGLASVPLRQRDTTREAELPGGNNPRNRGAELRANHHPTVKPVALMRWLVRLVTPPPWADSRSVRRFRHDRLRSCTRGLSIPRHRARGRVRRDCPRPHCPLDRTTRAVIVR